MDKFIDPKAPWALKALFWCILFPPLMVLYPIWLVLRVPVKIIQWGGTPLEEEK